MVRENLSATGSSSRLFAAFPEQDVMHVAHSPQAINSGESTAGVGNGVIHDK